LVIEINSDTAKTTTDDSTDTVLDIDVHVRFDSDGPIHFVVLRDSDDAVSVYDFHVAVAFVRRQLI
jgi:DNA-binding beta-propeller fold protein YncE